MPRRQRVWAGVSVAVSGAAAMVFGLSAPARAADSTDGDDEYTEVSLGALWALFTQDVAKLLPILLFIAASALAIIVAARLLALIPGLRNPRSMRGWRRFAWTVGIVLAIVTPALIALRGMWVFARGGPDGYQKVGPPKVVEEFGFEDFVAAVFWRSGFWWLLLLLLVVTLATLTFAFATRQGVTIKLKSKDDGKSLDSAHIMAAMDGMAGRTNRGLEFPVGTDLTTAATAVSELSDNKFFAAIQAAVSAILGSTPWTLAIENEGTKAASVTISRNGALMKAKRVKVGETLAGVTEITDAEQLAALISGELIATLRSRYRSEFDADLAGATDGESIALHYIASSALATTRATRARGIPILARAVELDPNNRAAWTTLANFAYRDPKIHDEMNPLPHVAYRDFLDRAILEELRRGRNNWDRATEWVRTHLSGGPHPRDEGRSALVVARHGVRMWRMRRNGLLLRLLQNRVVAAMNADAASKARGTNAANTRQPSVDTEYMKLRRDTFGGPLSKREPPKTAIRRRQLLLLDEFRASWVAPPSATVPKVLELREFAAERRAWDEVAPQVDNELRTGVRIMREDAALAVSGDFAHDPIVAYSLACYRAIQFASTRGRSS